ncbi:MAG: portal protein [Nitrososphaerales archaeon]
MAGGEFINLASQHSLLEQTNLQINRLERYKDFDQEDQVGEISAALDMYADEASLIDPETHHSLMVKAKSLRVKKELEDFFYNTLLIDNMLRPLVRYLCKYGDFPAEIVPTHNRTGIASLRHMNVYNFTRVETKYGDLVGFFYQDEMASQPTFFHPWQVMHLRLTSFENIYHPYGRSILDATRKTFKQLRLMEDAALIYRLTRAPEKRVFKVPVGNIPVKEVPQYIQLIAREFKKHRIFDPASGDVSERWSPLIQEDDIWLPKRADGTGPEVETLPGAENLDQIADIEYFKKKMISALKIPFSRVGIGEASDGDSEPLSKIAPEFAKAVQWIQREVVTGLKKVAIIHLALRGFSADDIRAFDLHMTASSAIDELYRIETWAARADVIDALKSTELFPDKWILQRFSNLTDDEIEQMRENKDEFGGEPLEIGGKISRPVMSSSDKGISETEPITAEQELDAIPIEGFNNELEKKVIMEYKEQFLSGNKRNVVKMDEYNSGFDFLLNSGELDELPGPIGQTEPMVRRVISEEEVKQAKREAEIILSHGVGNNTITEDITSSDIPQ